MRDKAADIKAVCEIDGWLTQTEAELLYGLAHNSDGPIVEIGSWHGRSTAALALGSMSGRRQPVYAIDPFVGVQAGVRPTSGTLETPGVDPGKCPPPSPEQLKKNLERAGVNGLVTVVHGYSAAVARVEPPVLPEEIGLLFVDGSHEYTDVLEDLHNYLPRLKQGGFVVFHDVVPMDPGVVRAVDDYVMTKPNEYRVLDRVDSALVVRKVQTKRRTVALACPGHSFGWGTVTGIVQSSLGAHRVDLDNNGNGWDDFNALWARALNRAERGEISHFAMLHSDVVPQPGWVDILMDELEELKGDLISVACPMKDSRGVCNCGWSDPRNRWGAWRRITVSELQSLPPTFSLKDSLHPDKVLLHNTGCFLADLRSPIFRQTDLDGNLIAWFDFPTKIRRDSETGQWMNLRESEDWFFSRQLHILGAQTYLTRKVRLNHVGNVSFSNDYAWGDYTDGDEDTRPLWEPGWTKAKRSQG